MGTLNGVVMPFEFKLGCEHGMTVSMYRCDDLRALILYTAVSRERLSFKSLNAYVRMQKGIISV